VDWSLPFLSVRPRLDTAPDDRTTDKRPALFLESRPDDIGYNDLAVCRFRRLVLERLRLNSYLPPFKEGKRSGQSFIRYSIFKVLKICFQLHYLTISHFMSYQEIAKLSPLPEGVNGRKTKKGNLL